MKEPSELAYLNARDFEVGKVFEGIVLMKYPEMIGFQPKPSAIVRFSIGRSYRESTVSEHGPERSQMAWDLVISDFRSRHACTGGEKGEREQFACHGHSMRAFCIPRPAVVTLFPLSQAGASAPETHRKPNEAQWDGISWAVP
jgi:hypothetical protein